MKDRNEQALINYKKNKFKWNDTFSFIGLLFTLFLSWRTYIISDETFKLQQKSDKEGQKIIGLNNLIYKTDSVIKELNEQLPLLREQLKTNEGILDLNGKIQSITNINFKYTTSSNKNRFFVALYNLANIIKFQDEAIKWNDSTQDLFIEKSKIIFESQATNPYVLQNDSLSQKWRNASNAINLFSHESVYDNSFSKEFYGRTRTRLDELETSKDKDDRTFPYCWKEVDSAFLYGVKVFKKNKLDKQ